MAFCTSATSTLVAHRCAGAAAPRTPAVRLSAAIPKLGFAQSFAVFGQVRMASAGVRTRAASMRTGVVASLSTANLKVGTQGKNVEVR
eukprot:125232-Pyramimonas_sp.AAC.1